MAEKEQTPANRRYCGHCNRNWDFKRGPDNCLAYWDDDEEIVIYFPPSLNVKREICPHCETEIQRAGGEVDYGEDIKHNRRFKGA